MSPTGVQTSGWRARWLHRRAIALAFAWQKVAGCKKGARVFTGEFGEGNFPKGASSGDRSADCIDAASIADAAQVSDAQGVGVLCGGFDVAGARIECAARRNFGGGGGDRPAADGLKSRCVRANADSGQRVSDPPVARPERPSQKNARRVRVLIP